MPNLATDLARVMELLEKATPGPWAAFNGSDVFTDWKNGQVELHIADCSVEATEFSELIANTNAIVSAINFLRQHGPEIAETFKETPNG